MKEKIGFFEGIVNATYNFPFYGRVIAQSLGRAIGYIITLSLLVGIIGGGFTIFKLNNIFGELKVIVNTKLPEFELVNGTLKMDSVEPIEIQEIGAYIAFDPENTIDIDSVNHKTFIIAQKNQLLLKESSEQVQIVPYNDMTISKKGIIAFSENVFVFIYVAMLLYSMIGTIVGSLINVFLWMGVGGLIMAAILKTNKSYSQCCKLGAYALTVPLFIQFVLKVIGLNIPGFWLVYIAIAFTYQAMAMLKGDSEDIYLDECIRR